MYNFVYFATVLFRCLTEIKIKIESRAMGVEDKVVDDLVQMGVIPEPIEYTGVRIVDFFLNHHMTPLFTMFLATVVIKYLY